MREWGESSMAFAHEVTIASLLRIGHRGSAGHAPENTLAAIWKARSFHADFVEVDVRETNDGHLVLLHDETVDRTTNETGPVAEMSLEQVQRLDAGDCRVNQGKDVVGFLAPNVCPFSVTLKLEANALRKTRRHPI